MIAAGAWHGRREALRSTLYLAQREIRTALRQPANFIPGMVFPLAFFFVLAGSLGEFASRSGVPNYKSFQLPVAVLFAVTSGSAGQNMVVDIESGYFDKLLLTPASRLSVLIGAMGADFVRIVVQGAAVTAAAMASGATVEAGWLGATVLILVASLWGLAYSAIGFSIALKTGSPAATQNAFLLFFPFVFLTTSFAPLDALTGWLRTAATYNPMTYTLRGLRSLAMSGWDAGEIAIGLAAVAGVGLVTITLAFRALIGRIR